MRKIFIFTFIFFSFLGSQCSLAQTIKLSKAGDLRAEEFDELGFDPTGLVGWWRLDGDGVDSSGKGNNGTVINATVTTNRFNVANKAMSFDGNGDYIDMGNPGSLNMRTSDFTISFWLKINTHKNYNGLFLNKPITNNALGIAIFGRGEGWIGATLSDGTASTQSYIFSESGPNVWGGPGISTGQWCLITYVRQGNRQYLYFNSLLRANDSTTTVYDIVNNQNTHISTTATYSCDGSIDDVKMFSRALTLPEITEMYNFEKDAKFSIEKTSGKVTAVEFVEDAGLPVEMRSKKDNLTVKGTLIEE